MQIPRYTSSFLDHARRIAVAAVRRRCQPRWRQSRAFKWSDHVLAGIVALATIGLAVHQALSQSDSASNRGGSPIVFLASCLVIGVLGWWLYDAYLAPALVSGALLIATLGDGRISDDARVNILAASTVVGVVYLSVSLWWTSYTRIVDVQPQVLDDAEAALFETGRRYLSAWLLLLLVALSAAWFAPRTQAIGGTEGLLLDAAGAVVLIDLVALLPTRIRTAHRAAAARSRGRLPILDESWRVRLEPLVLAADVIRQVEPSRSRAQGRAAVR